MKDKIKNWAETKTKDELIELAAMLIINGIDSEDLGFSKAPYCRHSGESLLISDDYIWEDED